MVGSTQCSTDVVRTYYGPSTGLTQRDDRRSTACLPSGGSLLELAQSTF